MKFSDLEYGTEFRYHRYNKPRIVMKISGDEVWDNKDKSKYKVGDIEIQDSEIFSIPGGNELKELDIDSDME